jgi:hypothetical protein
MYTPRIHAHRSGPHQLLSAHRDPWYDRPFDAGVLPETFFDSHISLAKVCPETALMYAVLEDAFLCLQKQIEVTRQCVKRALEAKEWFFSEDSDWLFSFVSVCNALGLEPEFIRKRLKAFGANPVSKHSRERSKGAGGIR